MMYQANPTSQSSNDPIIGIKMQKLPTGDHIPLANTDDNLGMISKYIKPPSSGTFVLASVNGSIQWIGTQDCEE